MKNKLYWLAFLIGLVAVLSGAAMLRRMGVPVQLGDLTLVQAASPAIIESFSGSFSAGYSMDWYTIDGGGGNTSGNSYQMTATIGQPDAGTSSGGSFTLLGGFLPGTFQPWHGYMPLIRK